MRTLRDQTLQTCCPRSHKNQWKGCFAAETNCMHRSDTRGDNRKIIERKLCVCSGECRMKLQTITAVLDKSAYWFGHILCNIYFCLVLKFIVMKKMSYIHVYCVL